MNDFALGLIVGVIAWNVGVAAGHLVSAVFL